MRILARHDRGATWTANRIRDEAAIKLHSLIGKSIHVGSVEKFSLIAVCTHGLARQIVSKHKHDIGRLCFSRDGLRRIDDAYHDRQTHHKNLCHPIDNEIASHWFGEAN